jgi:hypothetical protein
MVFAVIICAVSVNTMASEYTLNTTTTLELENSGIPTPHYQPQHIISPIEFVSKIRNDCPDIAESSRRAPASFSMDAADVYVDSPTVTTPCPMDQVRNANATAIYTCVFDYSFILSCRVFW